MDEVYGTSQLALGEYPLMNHTDLPDEQLVQSDSIREVAKALSGWVDNARSAAGRTSMFDRGAYTPPSNPYDEMRAALHALEHDDIVSGVAEITEAFAFRGLKFESSEADDADIFNQIAKDINLDAVMRRLWREEYAISQVCAAVQWGWKTYKVRGQTTSGNKRKKEYRVWAPTRVSVLDSTKVVPVNHGPLGGDMLAWCSTNGEVEHFFEARKDPGLDPQMLEFFLGRYVPDAAEKGELAKLGVDVQNLLVMNPERVFRHTFTKPDYERFAHVRLKSLFKHLDLKQQLVQADRATLIGMANYILLVRKGDTEMPAQQKEMENLNRNFKYIAKLPVIISDHRLQVDIIAPKDDFVLKGDRYEVLDQRILSRLLGTLSLGGRGQRNETNITLSRATARSMENRRHMLKRTLEENLVRACVEHPKNAGKFDSEPSLVFIPRNIALDIDQATIQALVGLRSSRELSRETILEYFGLDQETEAQRMEMEEEFFDDIFKTIIPFSGAQPGEGGGAAPPQVTGPKGGRPAGGGESKKNVTKPKAQTDSGNPSTAK